MVASANVIVQLGVLKLHHVSCSYEDSAEHYIAHRNVGCNKTVVQSRHVLPLKDVEVLYQLPKKYFSENCQEKKSAEKNDYAARGS
jgi:hypothetical protein